MDYFTKNPQALMDAIPTPRADDEDELADFRTGLTPKKGFSFKFGNEPTQNRPSTSDMRRGASNWRERSTSSLQNSA